jgi:hypothetical protein
MEAQQTQQTQPKQVALADVEIKDENIALNVMVAMLNMAQKRGTFTMEESSKCWECIQKFVKNNPQQNAPQNISMETTEKYENDGSGVFE